MALYDGRRIVECVFVECETLALSSPGKLFSVSLSLLRFVLAAWIGAAVLFVVTSVAEQTSPEFDSVIRDQLATIRFPLYYVFGTACYASAACLALIAFASGPPQTRKRTGVIMGVIAVSAIVYSVDYFRVYSPLQALITPPGQVRTQEFVRLHNLSRHINEAHLSLMLVAGAIAVYPFNVRPEEAESHDGG